MKYTSLEQYLEKTGKSERQLARILGITQPYVNQLKRGQRRPAPRLARKIEAVTGISFRSLLLVEGNGNHQPGHPVKKSTRTEKTP
jgi:transcriptional regulator with XRE-family HTH domain